MLTGKKTQSYVPVARPGSAERGERFWGETVQAGLTGFTERSAKKIAVKDLMCNRTIYSLIFVTASQIFFRVIENAKKRLNGLHQWLIIYVTKEASKNWDKISICSVDDIICHKFETSNNLETLSVKLFRFQRKVVIQ